jgi:hypothetical protein
MKSSVEKLKRLAASTAVAAALTAGGAVAEPLDLLDVEFTWEDPPTGGANLEYSGQGTGSAEVRWGGSGAPTIDKSAYLIARNSNPVPVIPVNTGVSFDFAEFTHINRPIPTGTSITGIGLNVTADVRDEGGILTGVSFDFDFVHNETPNSGSCPDGNPQGTICDDVVTVSLVNSQDSFLGTDGRLYTLDILGFLQGGPDPVDIFFSGENGTSQADMVAMFSVEDVQVPAPGVLGLMGLGLLGLALQHRRRV